MKITYRGDYALKTILDLSVHYGSGVTTIHELAERIDAPTKFLEQILLDLKRGGFVESRRGKIGGYALAKPPKDIKVADIVRFIDGPIEPIACTDKKYSNCKDLYNCAFRHIWQDVAKATSAIIDNITFQDLTEKARHRKEGNAYYI